MANRAPLVIASGRRQQIQKADTLTFQIDVTTNVPRLLLTVTDDDAAEAFSIRVSDNAGKNLFGGVNNGTAITSGTFNFGWGFEAGLSITSGAGNFCAGPNAGRLIVGGSNNFCIGNSAGDDITSGSQNFCVGPSSGGSITTTNSNFCFGVSAGNLLSGSNNFCLGTNSGASLLVASSNICIGSNAGNNASQLATSTSSIMIGGSTFTGGSNSIVCGVGASAAGANAIAMGTSIAAAANQAIFGTTNITRTIVRGALDVVRSTNACRVNAYNTAAADPPGTSFELVTMRWATNVARISTQKGSGGGTARDLAIDRDDVERVIFGSAETAFNDPGNDVDFRVESDNRSHMIWVDASTNNLAIAATSAPNFQSMVGGVFQEDGTAPSGNPSSGYFLYSESGEPKVRNTSGDITRLASYTAAGYGAGTSYVLTATSAEVVRGTTNSAVTLGRAGTYRLSASVMFLYNAATFGANQTLTVKLRRTNNTAADVTNAIVTTVIRIVTTFTGDFALVVPMVVYTTANSNDRIALFADVSVVPSAGSLEITHDTIFAERIA